MILCDTNVLIEFYKGNPEVLDALSKIGVSNMAASAVTVGELYFGALDKREMRKLRDNLSLIQRLPIDEEIPDLFIELLEKYSLSHNLNIPDAIIAATAIYHSIPLYTLNIKDFRFISGLTLFSE